MINVLINAYAVSPDSGSEPGLGWNWIVNLSKHCNLFIITEGEWRDKIEKTIKTLPQQDNIHFYYNPLPDNVRKMCNRQGDWRFYIYYRQWQKKSLNIAREIMLNHKIDIIHQLNMIGYREPGDLWKIQNIPFVWGPVGAYGWTSLKYLSGYPLSVKLKQIIKDSINLIQQKYYPLSKKAMKRADCVLAANSKVYEYIKRNLREDVILLNETGCYERECELIKSDFCDKEFNILWVGKFDYRKQIVLAIHTVANLAKTYPFIKLKIVGGDKNNKKLINLTKSLGIEQNIMWYGQVSHSEVYRIMQESDIFLFTSIDEGTPHVVLEAIQNSLPVICFDTCGQGDIVNENIGIKIPLSNSRQSSIDFAKSISYLIDNREILLKMKLNCAKQQCNFSWENKIQKVIEIYNKLLR